MKAYVQMNPDGLQEILQAISRTDPMLFRFIMENSDDFVAVMSEPVDPAAQYAASEGAPNPETYACDRNFN